jgi:hypothetical protein
VPETWFVSQLFRMLESETRQIRLLSPGPIFPLPGDRHSCPSEYMFYTADVLS